MIAAVLSADPDGSIEVVDLITGLRFAVFTEILFLILIKYYYAVLLYVA